MTQTVVGTEELYALLAVLGIAVVLVVAFAVALRSTRRTLREAQARLAVMIDPREDFISIRLKRLEYELAGLPPVTFRRDRPP